MPKWSLLKSARALVGAAPFILQSVPAQAQALPQRPPQYVLISFDGSYTNSMWQATREHALATNAQVTHFISGVDFLIGSNQRKIEGAVDHIYTPPQYKGGSRSAIGFGGDRETMNRRIFEMKASMDAGMEIGGHGNSHFDGTRWSTADWTYEFTEFFRFLYNAFDINSLRERDTQVSERDWKQALRPQLRSFRAPFLGRGPGLWETLGNKDWNIDGQRQNFSFVYDASDVAQSPSAWPEKSNLGFWYFRMAMIPVPGRTRSILSMDYNFYVAHSDNPVAPKDKPEKAAEFEEQMYQAYVNWFLRNYHSNRAPMNIGHHFSTWNRGAYWKALQRFMKEVCTLPEVRCATGLELAAFLEDQSPQTLAQYARGEFSRTNMKQVQIPLKVLTSTGQDNHLKYQNVRDGIATLPNSTAVNFKWRVENQIVANTALDLASLAKSGVSRIDLVKEGSEKSAIPLFLDWNPSTNQTQLLKWSEEEIAPCNADAHQEQVNPQFVSPGLNL